MTFPARRRWILVVVRGRSMLPTLRDGDRVLVRARHSPSDVGRIGVVRLPGDRPLSIKRLVHHGPDGWWVERDNRQEGLDSWSLGAIADADVHGVALARVWPAPRRL